MDLLVKKLIARGVKRGEFLAYLDWVILRNNTTITVQEATIQTMLKEFCYEGVAKALSKLVKTLIQILIFDLREYELTDEVKDAIYKQFEQEIVTLACLRAMLGWKEKEIYDELMSFRKRDS